MKKRLTILLLALTVCICTVMQVSAAQDPWVEKGKQVAADAAKITFPEDGSEYTAICPVCSKNVTWYAISKATVEAAGKTLSKNYHYYLSEDIDISLADKSLISAASSTGSNCCLHLNGKKLINRAFTALMGSGSRFNVMGEGTVQGSVTGTDKGATIQINTSSPSGAVVLYGGTYSKVNASDTTNVIAVRGNGGIIEMHDGATVECGTGGSAVYLNGEVVYTGAILRMYGGKIDATASPETAIDMEACGDNLDGTVEFYMYGGLLEGGSGTNGGNVIIRKNGAMYIHGGTVQGGQATNGGNIYISANGKLEMTNGAIRDGIATGSGGNVFVDENAVFTMSGGKISGTRDENGTALGGKAKEGGNIYLGYTGDAIEEEPAAFIMTGGTVENGTATSEGGNIYAKGTNAAAKNARITLKNATVIGGKATSNGGNITLNRSTMTMDGDAKILNGTSTGARAGNIRLYIGKIIMNDGLVAGGSAKTGAADNIWAYGVSNTYPGSVFMRGGVIEPSDDAHNTGVALAAYGRLYLAGDATILDKNSNYAAICVGSSSGNYGKLFVCDGWTGSADAYILEHGYAVGSAVSTTYAQVVTLKDDLTTTKGGSFTGTLTQRYVGTGRFVPSATSGTLTVANAVLVAQDGKLTATADPLADWEKGSFAYLKLSGDQTITDLGGKEICVDLNGHNLTVGGSGTLKAFDSRNDSYNEKLCGKIAATGSVKVAQEVDAPNGNRYIAITESGKTTMHRLQMCLTAVSMRTSQAGIYYKATYQCDEQVEKLVAAYGIVLSVHNMPGADFMSEAEAKDRNCYTCYTEDFASGVVVTSGSVFNIMNTQRDASTNDAYGQCDIYANPYLMLTTDAVFVGDTKNTGKTVDASDFDGNAYSLRDAMGLMDDIFFRYALSARNRINDFYNTWQDKGMAWQFVNIGAQANAVDNSDLAFAAGSTDAVCPVCRKSVTWKPVTQAAYGTTRLGNLSGGDHYYLAEDIVYTGAENTFLRAPGTGSAACLHLNGHNLSATNNGVITGYAGTINVMGNGTVSGNVADTNNGAAVHINTSGKNGTVNLYGGIYTKPATNKTAAVISIWANGGRINLYEGAQAVGNGEGNAVYVHEAKLTDAALGLHGARIVNGALQMAVPNTEAGFTSTLNITGNTYIENAVIESKYVKINLSGAPVIDCLGMAVNNQVNIGSLSDGADIKVSTRSVFTTAHEKIAQYAKYFRCWNPSDALVVTDDNKLRYDINYELYMTPYIRDVSAEAIADGKMHYYFMAGNGMVMSPTAEDNVYKWGDSCLVVFPNGKTMLIDSGYAVQQPVLVGCMKRMGITKLDYILITHPHNDHVNGVFGNNGAFLDEVGVDMVYHSGINHNGTGANAIVVEAVCNARGIPTQILEQGDELDFGDVHMQVLWPVAGTSETTVSSGSINDQSMVFRFDYGEHSSLFTADLYVKGEGNLMASVGTEILDVDFLKVPHHGWNTSSSADFVKAVKPELAVYTGGMMMENAQQSRYIAQKTTLLCDLIHGYIHVEAGDDGVMTYETSQ